jgi:regulator of protease activity HflC (stomatin/prohibitin superfamily)
VDVIVSQSFVGLLYEDGAFRKVLEPGKHTLTKRLFTHPSWEVKRVDLRERSITIKGQEILTADKVAVRVSLLVYFRVTDPEAALHNVASYEDRIYEDVQLAARRFLASRDLEAILSDRNEISDAVRDAVKGSAARYGVEVLRADVKDLIFPGNLREIMNQVLETERRAEANLIKARKDAEALRVKLEADNEASRLRLDSLLEQSRAEADAQQEKIRLTLKAEIEEAEAVRQHPEILKLRELATLIEMARAGGQFVIDGSREGLARALGSDERPTA